jgi:tRNA pseudouridine38-40 synthase
MRRAAAHLVGRHDYAAFARSGHQAPSTIVVVDDCRLFEVGELVLVRLGASHFLWGQVRRMVGALVAVGTGAAAPDDVRLWLAGAAAPPEPAAPASGLFLERVYYRDEPRELPPPVPVGVPWHPQWKVHGGGDAKATGDPTPRFDREKPPSSPRRGRRTATRKPRR